LREKNNLVIVRALTYYKMDSFSLFILEVTDKDNVLNREQFYLDEFKPAYNILTKAYNSLGFTHAEESIEKIRKKAIGRTYSLEVRKGMSENRKGPNNSFYGRKHTPKNIAIMKERAINRTFDPNPGFKVEIEDLNTKTKTVYKSEAARSLDSHMSSLLR
jgi:group I intron endonuclease